MKKEYYIAYKKERACICKQEKFNSKKELKNFIKNELTEEYKILAIKETITNNLDIESFK